MRLAGLLRGARAGGPEPAARPRRRAARADGPRTIVPVDEPAGRADGCAGDGARSPFDLRVDAARERLRQAIPPVDDDLGA